MTRRRLMALLIALVGAGAVDAPRSAMAVGTDQNLTLTPDEMASLRQDCIRPMVWGGFTEHSAMLEIALDFIRSGVSTPVDAAWISAEVERQWEEKLAAQATWPARTDWDRLDDAFTRLNVQRIIALHHAGITLSDGHSDIAERWQQLGGGASGVEGYAFYHGQDVERVLETGDLSVAFGAMPNSSLSAQDVAGRVATELEAAGFKVVRPVDAETRLLVIGVDWKKRSPVE
jgi:hypothetical protein